MPEISSNRLCQKFNAHTYNKSSEEEYIYKYSYVYYFFHSKSNNRKYTLILNTLINFNVFKSSHIRYQLVLRLTIKLILLLLLWININACIKPYKRIKTCEMNTEREIIPSIVLIQKTLNLYI